MENRFWLGWFYRRRKLFECNLMKFLKGQLLVSFLVVVVVILAAPIMHGKKIQQAYVVVYLPVFPEVLHQNWYFKQLVQRHIAKEQYKQSHITACFFHGAKIEV